MHKNLLFVDLELKPKQEIFFSLNYGKVYIKYVCLLTMLKDAVQWCGVIPYFCTTLSITHPQNIFRMTGYLELLRSGQPDEVPE